MTEVPLEQASTGILREGICFNRAQTPHRAHHFPRHSLVGEGHPAHDGEDGRARRVEPAAGRGVAVQPCPRLYKVFFKKTNFVQ